MPLFVLGFLACVALRSTGLIPEDALGWITHVQVAALGAALFGMGCSVKIASLSKGSGAVMVVSTVGTALHRRHHPGRDPPGLRPLRTHGTRARPP